MSQHAAFDRLTRRIDPAVVVVTVRDGESRSGCVVGFHSQSSIEPLRYCFWISRDNHTYQAVLEADFLTAHLLGPEDRDVAEVFGAYTGDEADKWALLEERHLTLPASAVGGRIVARFDDEAADHVGIVIEPDRAAAPGRIGGALRVSDLEGMPAGHERD